MKPQKHIARLVTERGYRAGWTPEQFAARQVAKLAEELGELAELFKLPLTSIFTALDSHISESARLAKTTFDSGDWSLSRIHGGCIEMAKGELADLQVVIFCLADVLSELSDTEFDVIEYAMEKARGDVGRGVR